MSTGCHGSQTCLRCASLLRMPSTHSSPPSRRALPSRLTGPTDTRTSSQVVLRTYACPPKTSVTFHIILGGGHAWPGRTFSQSISKITGFTTFQINATTTMWSFFQRFRLWRIPPCPAI
jgi:poly(3-hydroxybutyrate) depolymerase